MVNQLRGSIGSQELAMVLDKITGEKILDISQMVRLLRAVDIPGGDAGHLRCEIDI